jgi:hypothetical protein
LPKLESVTGYQAARASQPLAVDKGAVAAAQVFHNQVIAGQ